MNGKRYMNQLTLRVANVRIKLCNGDDRIDPATCLMRRLRLQPTQHAVLAVHPNQIRCTVVCRDKQRAFTIVQKEDSECANALDTARLCVKISQN